MSSSAISASVELVFIDAGVPDLDQLLNGLQDGMEAVLLTGEGDPVLQMRDALAGRSGRFFVSRAVAASRGPPGCGR